MSRGQQADAGASLHWEAFEVRGLWVTSIIEALSEGSMTDLESRTEVLFGKLRYVVIDEVLETEMTLVASDWPELEPSGALDFGHDGEDDTPCGIRTDVLHRFLDDAPRLGLRQDLRLGVVYAMSEAGWNVLSALGYTESEPGEERPTGQRGPAVLDVTASARLAARVSARFAVTSNEAGSMPGMNRPVGALCDWLWGWESGAAPKDYEEVYDDVNRPIRWRDGRPEPTPADAADLTSSIDRTTWLRFLEEAAPLMDRLRSADEYGDGSIDWRLAFPATAEAELADPAGLLPVLCHLRSLPGGG
jgi:hypothetical protein